MQSLNKDAGRAVAAPNPSGPSELNVGLFPYVPEPEWFWSAIEPAWAARHPGIALNRIRYDCYREDPPDTLDVFAYDCIFASYMRQFCREIDVDGASDFYDWSMTDLQYPMSTYWGVPYLGCVQVLIYRTSDRELGAGDLNVNSLNVVLGDADSSTVWPQAGGGLLLDLTGSTTTTCAYLQAVMEEADDFPTAPVLPQCPDELDEQGVGNIQSIRNAAGWSQATLVDSGNARMDHWNEGRGRAYVGLTEYFHFIESLDTSTFRVMPLSSVPGDQAGIPLFADAVSVNRNIEPAKAGLANELVNLIASTSVLLEAMAPNNARPQFLVPTRHSLMAALCERTQAPVYDAINDVVTSERARAFRLGLDSRAWLNANRSCVRDTIIGPSPIAPPRVAVYDESMFDDPAYASTPAGLNRRP